jgi:hypothetical protein
MNTAGKKIVSGVPATFITEQMRKVDGLGRAGSSIELELTGRSPQELSRSGLVSGALATMGLAAGEPGLWIWAIGRRDPYSICFLVGYGLVT